MQKYIDQLTLKIAELDSNNDVVYVGTEYYRDMLKRNIAKIIIYLEDNKHHEALIVTQIMCDLTFTLTDFCEGVQNISEEIMEICGNLFVELANELGIEFPEV